MTASARPFVALVDDDAHSARLIIKMLLAHGSPDVRWLDGPVNGAEAIGGILADPTAARPSLVIADLKASSAATRDFISALRRLPGGETLLVVAMAPVLDKDVRDTLIDGGADAVFQRHAELEPYRREVASIVSYWVRHQRLHAIGA